MLRVVAATRYDPVTFWRHTPLGRSLSRVAGRPDWRPDVAFGNSAGLPVVYTAAIARAAAEDVVVFTHDDVWLDDFHLPIRLREAFERFAVVGVAGNRRRVPRQPSFAFPAETFTWDSPDHLSGAVVHQKGADQQVGYFGECPAEVKLLDGVFLAAKVETLRRAGVGFDPRFAFHFYDLDFCRTCEQAGLPMGTWPIAITHASGGKLGTPDWKAAYETYLAKWGE
jgi:GT2 family glycosyltransferase